MLTGSTDTLEATVRMLMVITDLGQTHTHTTTTHTHTLPTVMDTATTNHIIRQEHIHRVGILQAIMTPVGVMKIHGVTSSLEDPASGVGKGQTLCVDDTGLEPVTFSTSKKRSSQLS